MPDVHFWHSQSLFQNTPGYQIKKKLQEIVAKHMDCFDDDGNWIQHDPYTQIDILTFAAVESGCTKDAVIQITAYDWPDRMRNIGERLRNIAEDVAKLLPAERGPVAASFHPIPRGEYPQGCWVKV
jgi:hypothetical protein